MSAQEAIKKQTELSRLRESALLIIYFRLPNGKRPLLEKARLVEIYDEIVRLEAAEINGKE